MTAYPASIRDQRASGVLCIEWQDGTTQRLPHALLRSHCRCAECRQKFRRTADDELDNEVCLTDVQFIADRALNLSFSDGHDVGIYPWDYLRQLGHASPPPSAP